MAFCALSFLIANLGLNAILEYSLPVLMLLYPLAIVLILLTLFGRFFKSDRIVLRWTVGFTAAASIFEFLRGLPAEARAALHLDGLLAWIARWLPLSGKGFGWILPALLGLLIGLLVRRVRGQKSADRR